MGDSHIEATLYVPSSMDELKDLLSRFNVPWETWGRNGNKGIAELFVECERGEIYFTVRNGKLYRELKVACLDLFWIGFKLIERAIIRDGVRMPRKSPVSASEKMKNGDGTVHDALCRLYKEEIFPIIDSQYLKIPEAPYTEPESKIKQSSGFPGLWSRYSFTLYRTRIVSPLYYAEYNYGKDEFIVKEPDKDMIFAWEYR